MKDLHNNIEVVSILDPVVVEATATHTDIDLQDFNSAELVINCGLDAGSGLSGSNKLVFTLKDSSDGTTYTAVETADMLGVTVASGVILTIDAVGEDNSIYQFGYVGGKRYLELTYTETGTVSMPMGIEIIKSHGLDVPAI
ncbi:MAG: hypothetical protein JRE23_02775 [Deltaproteobacteria bacterium]|nr:hypothetical protein [Deltaproteobacteria bacterium]